MLCRQFLSWAQRAPAGERADAARALAHAYLYAELDRIEQGEMERAMTCLLDDPSPLVRLALAEALAGAVDAPHHLVSSLANDQPDIAASVLSRSPLLTDAELIDAAALGEPPAQCAIARRPTLSAAVAGALAEVGAREALLVLCANDGARLAEVSAVRILERFGQDGSVREALGARADVSPALRHRLVVATAQTLQRFVTDCGWISPERARRAASDGTERAALALSRRALEREGASGLQCFADHLRRVGHLTPALVLRALMSGDAALFEATLVELSGQRAGRVTALLRQRDGLGFAALYRSAGLPEAMLPAFQAALGAARAPHDCAQSNERLQRRLIESVLAACGPVQARSIAGLTPLLRRFEAEAARDESRALIGCEVRRRPAIADMRVAA